MMWDTIEVLIDEQKICGFESIVVRICIVMLLQSAQIERGSYPSFKTYSSKDVFFSIVLKI